MASDLDIHPPMPADRRQPIACIGTGFVMSDCHLVAYRANGFNPVAIAGRNKERTRQVADRHDIASAYDDYRRMLQDTSIRVVDVAVPPDVQLDVIREVVRHPHIRGVLAQKPLAGCTTDALTIVELCRDAGVTLCVNQNMRYDQSVRACKTLMDRGILGENVLATIEMRAIPHWMPWQARQGWMTCRIMSIHHLDTMRYWFGNPQRVFASFRTDPRTRFAHTDGIGLYVLEYASGLRCQILDDVWAGPAREGAVADLGIRYRVEGTLGITRGTIGWPSYPERTASTLDYSTTASPTWISPRWDDVWFPDAFVGPMAELLCAMEASREPMISGRDNLHTLALVDACYQSAAEHRAIELD